MSKSLDLTENQINELLSPRSIRKQAKKLFELTLEGRTHFEYHPEKLAPTVEYVLGVIRKNYPDLNIPYHSRWGHFRAGGIDRVKSLDGSLKSFDARERARIKLDLVITSVLLDAGAGAEWKFIEKDSGSTFSRSEGLGIASLEMFLSGAMSSDKKSLRVDAEGLRAVTTEDINKFFQVSPSNPLVGVEGRKQLLNNLAQALGNKKIFKDQRPGNLLDYLIETHGQSVPAEALLRAVLDGLGPIWPGRLSAKNINLGDVWQHSQLNSQLKTGSIFESLVPFHKLSQWMTYSLMEPIAEAGIEIPGTENLTGLAEYRNGGLLIDSGLVSVKDSKNLAPAWAPDSDIIIEWRALTIYVLDLLGHEIQKALGKSPEDFPLAKVLEGGTWWAGRFLAKEKRTSGDPPLKIKSDGTVF